MGNTLNALESCIRDWQDPEFIMDLWELNRQDIDFGYLAQFDIADAVSLYDRVSRDLELLLRELRGIYKEKQRGNNSVGWSRHFEVYHRIDTPQGFKMRVGRPLNRKAHKPSIIRVYGFSPVENLEQVVVCSGALKLKKANNATYVRQELNKVITAINYFQTLNHAN